MADITPDTVEAALKDVRRGVRLRSSPLLGLKFLRPRLAQADRAVTDVNLEQALRDVLCEVVGTGLAAARGLPDRSALDARHTAAAARADLMADFDAGDSDREAWSTLYHRYTAPLPMEVQQIAHVTRAPGARNHERQIRRRCLLGHEKLAARLRQMEDDLVSAAPDRPGSAIPPMLAALAVHNVPHRPNRFVGRAEMLTAVEAKLEGGALVTLLGPGGVGKTRLAQQVARRQLAYWPDGVWWADLSDVASADQVLPAAARAVGITDPIDRITPDVVAKALQGRRVLLLLDNCEHVLEACARLADALLAQCPDLCIVATSRRRLKIEAEIVCDVLPLEVPADARAAPVPEQLIRNESVALFVDRAVKLQEGFRLDARNADDIGRLCRALEGIPLAIELAAGRVRTLGGAATILAQLADPLAALAEGPTTAPDRQKTMRKAIAWSYDLLTGPEQTIFARLAAFRGGWTFEAARQVCTDAALSVRAMLDGLGSLVEHSLVQVDTSAEEPRYRFLEPIRHFALERLAALGAPQAPVAQDPVRGRHLDYFMALAERAEPELTRADQALWLDRLDREYANLLAALDHALAAGQTTMGLRLASALWRYWDARGNAGDGRSRLGALLGAATAETPDATRAAALHAAGVLAMNQADYAPAMAMFEEAAEIRRRLEDWAGLGRTLSNIGAIQYWRGDYREARVVYENVLAAARSVGDDRDAAMALLNSAMVVEVLEGWGGNEVEASLEECIATFERIGDRGGAAAARHTLGRALYQRGEDASAEELFRQALKGYEVMSHQRDIAVVRRDIAGLLHDSGNYVAAEREYKLCIDICERIGDRWVESIALCHLGHVATNTSHLKAALVYYQQAIEMATRCENDYVVGDALSGIVRVRLLLGEANTAHRLMRKCLSHGPNIQSPRYALPWISTCICYLRALDRCRDAAILHSAFRSLQRLYRWRMSPAQETELSTALNGLEHNHAEVDLGIRETIAMALTMVESVEVG